MTESLFHLLWTTIWQSTLLAAMVFAVVALLGNRLHARFRYLLWCVVLLRLAVPMQPAVSWGIFSGHEPTVQRPMTIEKAEIPAAIHSRETHIATQPLVMPPTQPVAIETPFEPEPTPLINEHTHTPPSYSVTTATPVEPPSNAKTPFWKFCVLLVWAAGIVLLGIRYLLDEWQLFRQSRHWQTVNDPAMLELLCECRREVKLWRPVRFFAVPQNIGAASTGFWRSSVLISRTALDTMTPEQLRMILLHELVHVKRFDPIVLRIVSILSVIYWPHPVVWFALSRLQRDRELACDAAVLHILNQRKTADEIRSNQSTYGKTVLLFAETTSSERCLPGLVGASLDYRRHNTIARRIEMILKYKRSTILQAALGFLLVTVFVAFGLTRAAEKTSTENSSNDNQAIADETAEKPVHLIRGTVIDSEKKPVQGVFVRMNARFAEPATTDENGRFEFPVQERLYAHTPFYAALPGTDLVAKLHLPHIPEGIDELPELTIVLGKGRRFFGKVVDESGKPVEGAYVGASEQSLTIEPVLTDKDGNFEFYYPQSKTDDVFAIKPGVGFDFIGIDLKNHVHVSDDPPPQEVGPLTLTLTKTDPVSIHLEDESGKPIEGIRLQPWLLRKRDGLSTNISTNISVNCDSDLANKLGLFFAETDKNGNAVIDWLPKGIGLKREELKGLRESAMFTEINVFSDPKAKTRYTVANPLRWQPGETKLSTKLVKMVPIKGSVRLADGTPVPFASLSYGYYEGGNGWGFADSVGRFTFYLTPHTMMCIAVESNLGAAPAAFDIDAGDGSHPPQADFVLQNGTKFYGTVIAGDGSVPYRTNLTLMEYAHGEKNGDKKILRCVHTDENGYFETRLPKGKFDVYTWLPSSRNEQSDRKTFEITDETEKRMDFHFPDDRHLILTPPRNRERR